MTGQFQHGDLVLATRTTNKLLDKVVGLVTGTIEDDVVSIRMLHVKRRWGNDGHGRADAEFVPHHRSGQILYTDADVADVQRIDPVSLQIILADAREAGPTREAWWV